MQGNARETYKSGGKVPGKMQGKAGECQRNIWEWVYSARGMQGTTREMKGNAKECQGNVQEDANCQGMQGNAGECEGNVREWRQSARGRQGNAGECRGIQGNAFGMYGSGFKVPGECWGMQGNAK